MSCIWDCCIAWCKGSQVAPRDERRSTPEVAYSMPSAGVLSSPTDSSTPVGTMERPRVVFSPSSDPPPGSLPSPRPAPAPVPPRTVTVEKEGADEVRRLIACHTHEMRNALQGVQGGLRRLEERKLDPETATILRETAQSCDYLGLMAQDFLDYSKHGEHRYVLREGVFSIEDLKALVLRPTQFKALEKGLTLDFEIDSKLSRNIIGDKYRIAQLLINFVSNAIKFTATGSVTIRISIEADEGKGEQLRFAVVDTGKGISSDEQGKLFTPFAQAESDKEQGTGLGLYICKQLADLMNPGAGVKRCIGVDSALGRGSIFWFSIPYKSPPEIVTTGVTATPVIALTPTEATKFEKLKILVADDALTNQKLMSRMLVHLGCQKGNIVFASDGNEAVIAYKSGGFDLVLMDIVMPRCGGIEAAKQIRTYESEAGLKKPAQIIACTGNDSETYEGMDGVIAKPIDGEKLTKVLSAFS